MNVKEFGIGDRGRKSVMGKDRIGIFRLFVASIEFSVADARTKDVAKGLDWADFEKSRKRAYGGGFIEPNVAGIRR